MMLVAKCLAVGLLTVWPGSERPLALFSSGLANPTSVAAASEPSSAATAGPTATFSVSDKIQVPGKTLHAGAYTIRVVDHLSDRMILRVERKGKPDATFLALRKSRAITNSTPGPIRLDGGSKSAMRGFVFTDGTVAEFVYPKGEAVGLAKANSTTIPAIDPESEGRGKEQNLSNNDLQMVTLWMLSPTLVGPNESKPGITAARVPAACSAHPAHPGCLC